MKTKIPFSYYELYELIYKVNLVNECYKSKAIDELLVKMDKILKIQDKQEESIKYKKDINIILEWNEIDNLIIAIRIYNKAIYKSAYNIFHDNLEEKLCKYSSIAKEYVD